MRGGAWRELPRRVQLRAAFPRWGSGFHSGRPDASARRRS